MKSILRSATLGLPATMIFAMTYAEPVKGVPLETSDEIVAEWRTKIEDAAATLIPLDSDEGQQLLSEVDRTDFELLSDNYVPQLKSHCGAASAVVVQNAMLPDAEFTQDSLFTDETAHIITQDVVYRIGFTLEELDNMIETRSGLKTTRFHAGEKDGQHGYAAWVNALKTNNARPDNHLIINYPTQYPIERENKGGHFSPIAAYHEGRNLVLILEINPRRGSYWLDAKEVWKAMNQIDSVSGMERGWIVVEQMAESRL